MSTQHAEDPPLVVVLGASGFVGAAVTAELAGLPLRLRLVSRTRRFALPATSSAEIRLADLTEARAVRDAVTGADMVVHLAAHFGGERSWRTLGTESERLSAGLVDTLVRTARHRGGKPPVVVFASSLQASAAPGQPLNEYTRHKVAAEELLHKATLDGTVRGIALRPATIYGCSPLSGWTGRGVVATMARKAIAGEPITMWHDGSVERDLLHVTDAARAFAVALRYPEALCGGSWPVGTGNTVRLGDAFRTLAGLVAARTGRPPVPVVTVPPPDWADPTDFGSANADPSAFAAATGWRPLVTLNQGLSTVVDALVS